MRKPFCHVIVLVSVLMWVLTCGCGLFKSQIKPPEINASEEKPVPPVAEKGPVIVEKPQVETTPPVVKEEEEPVALEEEPQQEEPQIEKWERSRPKAEEEEIEETWHAGTKGGRITTLDFHEEKLCNLLKIFSHLTGKNVVAKDNITDLEITVFLKNVTPATAIEVICKQYGLWYEENKDYIRLMSIADYGEIEMSEGRIGLLMFKGRKLGDALKVFSERTGKNVVCKANISDIPVNLLVRDVSVLTAIEVICKKYNLWYREDREKGYVCLMKAEDFGKDMGVNYEVKTRIFNLKYASAPQLADSIGCVMGDRVEYAMPTNLRSYEHLKLPDITIERGSVQQAQGEEEITKGIEIPEFDKFGEKLTSEKIEELIKTKLDYRLTAEDLRWIDKEIGFAIITIYLRNNSIIACSTDDRILEELAGVIEDLDTPTPQVLIECKVLKVSLSDDFTSLFDVDFFQARGRTAIRIPSLFGTFVYSMVKPGPQERNRETTLDGMLKLLKEDGRIRVVATPMLVSVQNSEAETFLGTKDWPFVSEINMRELTDEYGNVTEVFAEPVVTKHDIGTTLRFTPQINENRTVTLRLYIKDTTLSTDHPNIPYYDLAENTMDYFTVDALDETRMETIITVPEGHTLALGGLVIEKDSVVETKVPFLGDIPLIRFFFRDHKTVKHRTETVFLLTPHTIMAPEETDAVSRKALEGVEHPVFKEGKKNLFEFDEKWKNLKRTEGSSGIE